MTPIVNGYIGEYKIVKFEEGKQRSEFFKLLSNHIANSETLTIDEIFKVVMGERSYSTAKRKTVENFLKDTRKLITKEMKTKEMKNRGCFLPVKEGCLSSFWTTKD
jgi:hypothetical protein